MPTENKNHYELKMMRKEKNAMKEYHNDIKRIDDNQQLKLYQQPLAEALKDKDSKWQKMTQKELYEQARIQLKKHQYNTQQTRYGPYA